MTRPSLTALFVSLAFASGIALAEDVTIAYQTGIDPSKVPQANGEYEKATGSKINWRKFESGAEVVAAVASGDVPIGNIGSSPLAAGRCGQPWPAYPDFPDYRRDRRIRSAGGA